MDNEKKEISIIMPDNQVVSGELMIWEEAPNNKSLVQINLNINGKYYTKQAEDFFAALNLLREELEREDIFLKCYGSSKNVYPSPMQQNMGYGRTAYKLQVDKKAEKKDLVDIFEFGEDVLPVKIAEQQKFYQEWLRSITK
jgi:hypothetical protein